jgi:hypothetical protein
LHRRGSKLISFLLQANQPSPPGAFSASKLYMRRSAHSQTLFRNSFRLLMPTNCWPGGFDARPNFKMTMPKIPSNDLVTETVVMQSRETTTWRTASRAMWVRKTLLPSQGHKKGKCSEKISSDQLAREDVEKPISEPSEAGRGYSQGIDRRQSTARIDIVVQRPQGMSRATELSWQNPRRRD